MTGYIKTTAEAHPIGGYALILNFKERFRMKHQLIKLVCERANITEGQADEAVEAVIDYFKTRLPAEFATELGYLAAGHNQDNDDNRK
jgi:hypothetical protein